MTSRASNGSNFKLKNLSALRGETSELYIVSSCHKTTANTKEIERRQAEND